MNRNLSALALAATTLAAAAASASANSAVLIPPFAAGTNGLLYSQGSSINAAGLVVGYSSTSTGFTPFSYSTSTKVLTNLGEPNGATSAFATGVNTAGIVVGNYTGAQFTSYGFTLNTSTGAYTYLTQSEAENPRAINNSGTFVGTGEINNGGTFPIEGTAGNTAVTTLPGISSSTPFAGDGASAINSKGLIVGFAAATQYGTLHVFSYDSAAATPAATLTDLGTYPNPTGGRSNTDQRMGVNDAGVIAGSATLSYTNSSGSFASYDQAFRLVNGTFTGLSSLTGAAQSTDDANAINNSGVVVGSSVAADGSTHAVLWLSGSTTPVDLNTSFATLDPTDAAKFTLTAALAINDNGVITGTATDVAGDTEAFDIDLSGTLSAPEPTSLALLSPIAMLVLRRRRRQA